MSKTEKRYRIKTIIIIILCCCIMQTLNFVQNIYVYECAPLFILFTFVFGQSEQRAGAKK